MKITQHSVEIEKNLEYWKNKPLLKKIYHNFHRIIANELSSLENSLVVELGSGIGNIKDIIPHCIRTDIFENPWIDRVENSYKLSFDSNSVTDIILFDVFHHLEYPGEALREFERVLVEKGRIIIFEPYTRSLFGKLIFALFHHEPVGDGEEINWFAPDDVDFDNMDYYAAQGNCSRIFFDEKYDDLLSNWEIKRKTKFSALSYVMSGGYSKPQLYPNLLYPFMIKLDSLFDLLPIIFATRVLVVLEKNS